MRYTQLRAFHHVAVHGGFSRAAEALHVTQPAISDQVRKFEAEYGVRLFDRRKRQVVLTEKGRALLDITHRLFELEARALEFMSESRAARTGTLRIMADSAHHVVQVLARFRALCPEVFVSIRSGNSAQVARALYDYEADIGVLGDADFGAGYESVVLGSSAIIAFAPVGSAYAKRRSIRFEELCALPLVLRERGSRTRAKLEAFAARSGVALQARIEAEGREAVREVVAAGGGVGVVSEAEFADVPTLARIRVRDMPLEMEESLVCLQERRDSQLVRTFMDLATESPGAVGGGGAQSGE